MDKFLNPNTLQDFIAKQNNSTTAIMRKLGHLGMPTRATLENTEDNRATPVYNMKIFNITEQDGADEFSEFVNSLLCDKTKIFEVINVADQMIEEGAMTRFFEYYTMEVKK